MTALQAEIEQRLADAEPQVEVLLAELVPGPDHPTLRVFIDHPDGVTLSLCERVSGVLIELRDRYTLEVSSPGSERPLSKPDHFRRYIGRRARVRVRAQGGGGRSARRARGAAQGAEAEDACTPRGAAHGSEAEDACTPASAAARAAGGRGGAAPVFRRSYTGELVGASDSEITLAAESGVVAIPYSDIRRCNLVEE
jgi:ribosome maturation factor RimP